MTKDEHIQALTTENQQLEAWIDDLQSGMYINCVYCGHRYGPNKGNHRVTMRKALETHIAECPKHPLAMARNRIKELTAERDADRRREYGYSQQTVDALTKERDKLEVENKRLREQYNSLIFEVSYKFPGESRHETAKRYIREREEHGIEIVAKQALKEASHDRD
jgi:hypothetical protein